MSSTAARSFGGGTIYYPSTTTAGTFGAVAISPGYIGAQNDSVAPVGRHAIPVYNGLTNLSRKAYVELRGASHYAPNTRNKTIASTSISWLKRFVDDDLRYSQFLCPAPGTSTAVSDYRTPCGY